MTNTMTEMPCSENSVAIFRSLIAKADLSGLSDAQLYDLGAIATESAEGLCQGLLCISESLENCEIVPPEGVSQLSAFLKATAHLMPALFELCEKANDGSKRELETKAMSINLQ